MSGAGTGPPVAVCIPAYNEEATIAHTLDSVLKQSYPNIVSILVCANGCSDGTAAAARSKQKQDGRIVVRERGDPGKPDAWNELVALAPTDLIVFMDGDVVAAPDAVAQLVAQVEDCEDCIAVAARPVPSGKRRRRATSLRIPPPFPEVKSICGRMYLLRIGALMKRLGEFGIEGMPSTVIHEDAWLTLFIGSERLIRSTTANVYFSYPRFGELLKVQKRTLRAQKQLRRLYPRVHRPYPQHLSRKVHTVAKVLRSDLKPFDRVVLVIHLVLRNVVDLAARIQLAGEPARAFSEAWAVAWSSKEPPKERLAAEE
jgi:glycosyltransferase involved in cell wall biosynthesis